MLAIVPFVTVEALERLLAEGRASSELRVVARWRPEDIRSGVSDLAIYPALANRGIPFYVNSDIHLKLYVFESNTAFCGSANLTARGLGYTHAANLEAGVYVDLHRSDWTRLYNLIAGSRQVDDEIFQRYEDYAGDVRAPTKAVPLPDLLGPPKVFTISSLPAVESPERLAELYFSPGAGESAEEIRRAAHDLAVFNIPEGLDPDNFNERLALGFKGSPFVSAFVNLLKEIGSLRFGAVADWLHQHCEDVPLPYRWEIKANTRILYDWLEYFFMEIRWHRPRHSQVIYWQEH